MVEYVARDDQSLASPDRPRTESGERRSAAQRGPRTGPPRSDIGTIILHWITAVAFFVSIFTGVRIAADDPDAFVSKWLEPILPQVEVWTWHFLAGLALFFCASAYIFYMARSRTGPDRQGNAMSKPHP